MFASRRLLTLAVILGAGAGVLAQSGKAEPAKQKPGIYIAVPGKDGAEALTKLVGGRPREVKQTGMAKMMLSQGMAKGSFRAELGGGLADVRVPAAPKFYFYFDSGADKPKQSDDPMAAAMAAMAQMNGGDSLPADAKSAGDFTLVHMSLNKAGNREAEVGKMTGSGSSSSSDAVPCTVERLAQGQYVMTPKSPLKPGEYAFYYANNPGGGAAIQTMWDFGVDK